LGGLTSLAAIAVGVAGVYWLMVLDAHFLLLAAFGAGCGGLTGRVLCGRRSWVPGAAFGFVAPLVYIPLWLVLDLPPNTGIDL
jgi:hypothetical protein